MNRRWMIILSLMAPLTASAVDPSPADPAPAKSEAEKYKTLFFDMREAGIEGKFQGEYVGGTGAGKWGAQVIAMGDGKFHAAFLPGGLPGAGWDAKARYETEGTVEAESVALHGVEKVAWSEGHFPPPGVEVKKGFEAVLSFRHETSKSRLTYQYKVMFESSMITATLPTGEKITMEHAIRHSPTEGLKPADGAIILFDGSNIDAWTGTKIAEDGPFKGTLQQGGTTKQKFTDYTLHVEFVLPLKPFARQQERGNSGIYNQNRYEIQVLDSFGVMGMDNQCGGIYTKAPPAVNMCFAPLTWQTYDVDFTAARHQNGKKTADAIISVKHNGVVIHDQFKINGPTGGGQKEKPEDAVQSGPLYLQNHGGSHQ